MYTNLIATYKEVIILGCLSHNYGDIVIGPRHGLLTT